MKALKKTAFDGLLAAEILWDIEALLGRQSLEDLDLEALETAVRRQALLLAGRAVEQRLNADHSDAASHAGCECGQLARYAGRREKQFESVLGPLKLKRAYFYCEACGHGFLSARPAAGCRPDLLVAGRHADGCRGGRDGQF